MRLVSPTYAWAMAGQLIGACAQPLVLNAITKIATGYLRRRSARSGSRSGRRPSSSARSSPSCSGRRSRARHGITLLLAVEAAIGCAALLTLAVGLRTPPAESGPAAGAGLAELRAAWSVSMVRWLSGIMFVGVGVFVAVSTYLQPILHHDHISSTAAGLMLAGMLLAGVAGCAINPPIVARRGAQRGYLTLAVVCVAIAMALLAIAHAVAAFDFVAIAAVGFLLLAALPVILELTERRMGSAGGVATGILLLMGNLGGLIVAVAVGLVSGTPVAAFLLAVGRDSVRAADRAARPLRSAGPGRRADCAGAADARRLTVRRFIPAASAGVNRCKVRRIDLHLGLAKAPQSARKLRFTAQSVSVVTTDSANRCSSFRPGCRHGL